MKQPCIYQNNIPLPTITVTACNDNNYGAFFLSKFKFNIRFSSSTFVFQVRHWLFNFDIRFSNSTFVFQVQHSFFKLDIGYSSSTFVFQVRHSFFKFNIRFSSSTFVFQVRHLLFKFMIQVRHLFIFKSSNIVDSDTSLSNLFPIL